METLFTFNALTVAIIPIVTGLVSVLKTSLKIDSRFAPVASILFAAALVTVTGGTWQVVVIQGVIIGLAASGLYSGTKAVRS